MKSPDGLGKQKSSYFEDAFDERGVNPLKDRLRSEAIVMAEVRTNVIVSTTNSLCPTASRVEADVGKGKKKG